MGTKSNLTVNCLVSSEAELGEGVMWHSQEQALYWVDILKQTLSRYDPKTKQCKTTAHRPSISSVFPATNKDGSVALVSTFADGIKLIRPDNSTVTLCDPEPSDIQNRINDACTDQYGNLWFGTMHKDIAQASGRFYVYTASGKLKTFDNKYWVTNGPAIDTQNHLIYFVDTENRTLLRATYSKDGDISGMAMWLSIPDDKGYPDGITIDSEGCVWVAHWAGARVSRYSPQADLLMTIDVPALNVTKCALGGPNMTTLFITTARAGMTVEQIEQYPLTGSVFSVELSNIKGRPVSAFKVS